MLRRRKPSFNTQPPEGGWAAIMPRLKPKGVSTHSRLKAAGTAPAVQIAPMYGFNTQPPEGGWLRAHVGKDEAKMFQHTAA